MLNAENYFFKYNNALLTQKDADKIDRLKGLYKEMGEKIEQILNGHVYILNHIDNNFIYVSKHSPIYPESCLEEYLKLIFDSENAYFSEGTMSLWRLMQKLDFEDKRQMVFYRNICIENEGRKNNFDLKAVPLLFNDSGGIIATLFLVYLPIRRTQFYMHVKITNKREIYIYSTENHEWSKQEIPKLTVKDCEILSLSAQGLTTAEVADMVKLSESTVKQRKRILIKKLNTNSLLAALSKAAAYGII